MGLIPSVCSALTPVILIRKGLRDDRLFLPHRFESFVVGFTAKSRQLMFPWAMEFARPRQRKAP